MITLVGSNEVNGISLVSHRNTGQNARKESASTTRMPVARRLRVACEG